MGHFWRGLLIGLSIAAPVGPIGLLCIRRTLQHGRLAGFVSGLGAATADCFYGAVAAYGLTLVSQFLLGQGAWLRLVGGACLVGLGVRTFLRAPAAQAEGSTPGLDSAGNEPAVAGPALAGGLAGAYLSTLFLTLTNPLTILTFSAIMAGLGQGGRGSGYASATLVMVGVFSGSALWWFLLSTGVAAVRGRLGRPALQFIQRASGALIMAFGLFALAGR